MSSRVFFPNTAWKLLACYTSEETHGLAMSGLLSAGEDSDKGQSWMSHSHDLQFLPSCPFSYGSFLHVTGSTSATGSKHRHFNHEAGGLQGSWWWAGGCLCVTSHVEMNTCFVINPWKSVMWHGQMEVSALHGSSRLHGVCFPRDKHPLISAGDHIAAQIIFCQKWMCFLNVGGTVNSSKALAQL